MVLGQVRIKKTFRDTINHKLYETNTSLDVK